MMGRWSWILVVVGVLLVCGLLVAAYFLGRRGPRKKTPREKVRSPADAWREILSKLPKSARSLPVVVVVGERGAGKSRLIRAVFGARTGFTGEVVTARDDSSVSAFATGPVLVQEVAGELFESEGLDALTRLHDLWAPLALEIALVVFVGPASNAPERHAQRIRRVLDLLSELRGGSLPRCSVCVTRLDESAEGFTELVFAAERAGSNTQAPLPIASASELRAAWEDRFRDCYYAALAHLPSSEFARATRFPEKSGPELAAYVDALFRGVFRGRAAHGPLLVALAAMPDEGSAVLLGDPFAPDNARLDDDRRVLEQRRALRSAAFSVAACVLVAVAYAWHHGSLRRAGDALSALRAAAARAKSSAQPASEVITAEPEVAAASALDSALTPLYLPLRLAFPNEKAALVQDYLGQIRNLHLRPRAIAPDRATRVYAASLLYAARDNPLGRSVRTDPRRWATALGMPAGSVQHYLDYSERPFAGPLAAGELAERDLELREWGGFFDRLDAVIARGRFERPEELAELRAVAERLTIAMRWAVQEPELRPLIQLIEFERGAAEVEVLLGGKPSSALQAPPWVLENRDAIQSVLALVKKGEVTVPAAVGKSLRQALADLDAIGAGSAKGAGSGGTIAIDGKVREYQPETWTKILSESRSMFYTDALLRDLSASARSLFFVSPNVYPDLPASPVLGRGPSASIAGVFTPAAFNTEIRGPVQGLDAKLEAARVPESQRAALKAAIQREIETYAGSLADALFAYLRSFRFEATDVGLLRTYVADMVPASSWFAEFWANIAQSAGVDVGEGEQLRSVRRAVASLAPIVTLMKEDKGAFPNLEPYNASLVKVLPALQAEPLVGGQPKSGPLPERLSPVGKLGLALLDPQKPGPLQEVEDWLTKSNVLDDQLREPFRAPIRAVYEQALRALEDTASNAYTSEMQPSVLRLFEQFPFDPCARTDSVPADVQVILGPKGRFLTTFQDIYGPLTSRDAKGDYHPRSAAGYRAVSLSREALAIGRWAGALAPFLWEESGAPRPIPVMARPIGLAKIQTGAADAPTLAVLRSGATTIAAFNQATSWKALPVEWWTASPAAVGIEFTAIDGSSRRALSAEASGAAWRFFHLLRRGHGTHGVVRWSLDKSSDHDVAFQLQSDPWALLIPPGNAFRSCLREAGGDGT